jgi:hypothetical protein
MARMMDSTMDCITSLSPRPVMLGGKVESNGEFERDTLEVPPGLENYRETILTVTAPLHAASGDIPSIVRATASSNVEVTDQAAASLAVHTQGVTVSLSPPSDGRELTSGHAPHG